MPTVVPMRNTGHVMGELVALWIVSRSYSANSARQRRSILHRFAEATGHRRPDELTATDVLEWWESTADLAPASRRAHHSAVRSFLAWCESVGIDAPQVLDHVRRPKVPRRPPRVLAADEEERLRAVVAGTRDELAVVLMLDAGLRRVEVSRIRGADIDPGRATMTVWGKGDAIDVVPCPDSVLALWDGRPGRLVPFTPEHIAVRVSAAMRAAGIRGRTPHALRRTFATRLMLSGTPAVDVMRLMRHQSMATMTAYVASSFDAA